MIKAFEMTPERRLKLYYSGEDGGSVATLDEIPVEAILALPTSVGADITLALSTHGWGWRHEAESVVWYRGDDEPEADVVVGTTTRSSVALKILCAMVANGNYHSATLTDAAFDLADRFIDRMGRR